MQRLRKLVKEQNIYRWAGNLIADLCEVRLDGMFLDVNCSRLQQVHERYR
jgi:hypothetical protein